MNMTESILWFVCGWCSALGFYALVTREDKRHGLLVIAHAIVVGFIVALGPWT